MLFVLQNSDSCLGFVRYNAGFRNKIVFKANYYQQITKLLLFNINVIEIPVPSKEEVMKHSQLVIKMQRWGTILLLLFMVYTPFFGSSLMSPVQAAASADSLCSAGQWCIFLPFQTSMLPASGDLELGGLEVTQAVQDAQNSVALVAGRTTVLRIFATSTLETQALSDVKVLVTADRDGTTLSGSPSVFQASIPLSASRADYASSINLKLPNSWLSGSIDLSVRLDPDNTVAEVDEGNNILSLHLIFIPVPPLNVVIVPVRYTHTPNGITYAPPAVDTISSWMYRVFPISQINIAWHSVYSFTGNLRNADDWSKLLYEVTSLKSSEGAPSSTVYYGFVPVTDGSSTWFFGGIAGIGWVGSRSAVGLNTASGAPTIAAHEVGHNLGLWHSPCGATSGLDPEYPYAGGIIGQYGLDVISGTVYSPETSRDLMSYCNPRWISDYSYTNLMQAQIQYGTSRQAVLSAPSAQGAAQRSLLVRAQIDAKDAHLLPMYVLHAQQNENPPAGDYLVQLLSAAGDVLSAVPVQVNTIDGGETQRLGLQALVPLPAQPVAAVRLLKNGAILAERPLQTTSARATDQVETVQVGDELVLRWNTGGTPVMLRYTSDAGMSWTTFGVDLLGGEYTVDFAALPAQGGDFEVIPADTWR